MDGQRITAEQIEAVLQDDIKALAQQLAAAMNAAKAGRIIADSEEPVRDAHGEFRQRAFQKVIDLLAKQQGQEAFSPSARRQRQVGQQG
jgi:hypothetical protein